MSNVVELIVSTGLNASIYNVGQRVSINDITGVVFDPSSKKIVSTTQTEDIFWASAKTWCSNVGQSWYLPSVSELSAVYSNKAALNNTLSAIGGNLFSSHYYWSSTTASDIFDQVYIVSFQNGQTRASNKEEYSRHVCAVCAL